MENCNLEILCEKKNIFNKRKEIKDEYRKKEIVSAEKYNNKLFTMKMHSFFHEIGFHKLPLENKESSDFTIGL